MRCAVNDQILLFISQYSTVQYSTVQYSTEQLGCLTRAVSVTSVLPPRTSRPMRCWRHLAGNLDNDTRHMSAIRSRSGGVSDEGVAASTLGRPWDSHTQVKFRRLKMAPSLAWTAGGRICTALCKTGFLLSTCVNLLQKLRNIGIEDQLNSGREGFFIVRHSVHYQIRPGILRFSVHILIALLVLLYLCTKGSFILKKNMLMD